MAQSRASSDYFDFLDQQLVSVASSKIDPKERSQKCLAIIQAMAKVKSIIASEQEKQLAICRELQLDKSIELPKDKERIKLKIINEEIGSTALSRLISNNDYDNIKALLDFQLEDVNRPLNSPYILYAIDNHFDLKSVKLLAECKASVNTKRADGSNTLQLAIYRFGKDKEEGLQLIKFLLANGVYVNAIDNTPHLEQTPISALCNPLFWDETVFDMLVAAKAELKLPSTTCRANSPMLWALMYENIFAIQKLVKLGFSLGTPYPKLEEKAKMTHYKPLDFAILANKPVSISFLLKNGIAITDAKKLLECLLNYEDQRNPAILDCLVILCAQQQAIFDKEFENQQDALRRDAGGNAPTKQSQDPKVLTPEDLTKAQAYLTKLKTLTSYFAQGSAQELQKTPDTKDIPFGVLNIIGLFGTSLEDRLEKPFKASEIDDLMKKYQIK